MVGPAVALDARGEDLLEMRRVDRARIGLEVAAEVFRIGPAAPEQAEMLGKEPLVGLVPGLDPLLGVDIAGSRPQPVEDEAEQADAVLAKIGGGCLQLIEDAHGRRP